MVTPNGMKETIDALNEALDIAVAERDQAFAEIDALKADSARIGALVQDFANRMGTSVADVVAGFDRQQTELQRLKDALATIADPAIIPLGSNLWDTIVTLRHAAWKAIQH